MSALCQVLCIQNEQKRHSTCCVNDTTNGADRNRDNYVNGGNDISAETQRGQKHFNATSRDKRIPGKKNSMCRGHVAEENSFCLKELRDQCG